MDLLEKLEDLIKEHPSWKRLAKLPDRVAELEKRVKELESKLEQPLSKKACPFCGERQWFVYHSRKMPNWTKVERRYECKACKAKETVME